MGLVVLVIVLSIYTIKLQTCKTLSTGDIIEYRLGKAKISAIVGNNSVSATGISFFSKNYPVSTIMSVNVHYVGDGINYDLTIDNHTRNIGYITDMYYARLHQYMIRTSLFTRSLIMCWEGENFDTGLYLFLEPYISPTSDTWEYMKTLGQVMIQEKDAYVQLGNEFNAAYLFQDKDDKIYFETWNEGNVTGEYDDILGYPYRLPQYCYFENHFQIVFDKKTGALLGMALRGETLGQIDEGPFQVELSYSITQDGYHLPWFKLDNFFPRFSSIFFPLIGGGIIGLVIFVIVKKKHSLRKSTTDSTNI